MSIWVQFDSTWVLRNLEHPLRVDSQVQERPELLEELRDKLRCATRAILKENPDNSKNLIYYFHDPLRSGWAVAASIEIEGAEARFLFNLLPGGGLAALQVWFPTLTH